MKTNKFYRLPKVLVETIDSPTMPRSQSIERALRWLLANPNEVGEQIQRRLGDDGAKVADREVQRVSLSLEVGVVQRFEALSDRVGLPPEYVLVLGLEAFLLRKAMVT